jgi:prepilin-type N-terminal cleavage/methylation domain-containing protein
LRDNLKEILKIIMRKNVQAFTLIELLVTMTVAGILFTISMPMFTEFQESSRLKTSAQTVETYFGEAFSSSRSRPEYFVIEGGKDLQSFDFKVCKSCSCEELKKETRVVKLNPGIKFRENFEVCFVPPFGDMKFLPISEKEGIDILNIEIYNKNSVFFQVQRKSGLMTKIDNSNNPEYVELENADQQTE